MKSCGNITGVNVLRRTLFLLAIPVFRIGLNVRLILKTVLVGIGLNLFLNDLFFQTLDILFLSLSRGPNDESYGGAKESAGIRRGYSTLAMSVE